MTHQIRPVPASPVAFALVARFMARFEPFSEYEFGRMVGALMHQLEAQSHLVATRGEEVVGYIGWVWTSRERAEIWSGGHGPLQSAPEHEAAAVTMIASGESAVWRGLIRDLRRRYPERPGYWRRHDPAGLTGRRLLRNPR
jgi:hypothetical protein